MKSNRSHVLSTIILRSVHTDVCTRLHSFVLGSSIPLLGCAINFFFFNLLLDRYLGSVSFLAITIKSGKRIQL